MYINYNSIKLISKKGLEISPHSGKTLESCTANCGGAGKGKELEGLMKSIDCIGFDCNRTYPLLKLKKITLAKESGTLHPYLSPFLPAFWLILWCCHFLLPLELLSLMFLCLDSRVVSKRLRKVYGHLANLKVIFTQTHWYLQCQHFTYYPFPVERLNN